MSQAAVLAKLGATGVITNSGGNVGIGTSTPNAKLHVQTGINSGTPRGGSFTKVLYESNANTQYIELQTPLTATVNDILFSGGSSGNYGSIGYNTSSDTMRIHTASTERMRIDSSGNVGIGTNAPTNLLHVSTTAAGSNSYNLRMMNLGTTVSTSVGALWTTKDVGNNNISSAIISTTTDTTSSAGGTALSFATTYLGGLVERMRIDSGGNFLVGVNSSTNPNNGISYGALIAKKYFIGNGVNAGPESFAGGAFTSGAAWDSTGSSHIIPGAAVYGADNSAGILFIVASNKLNPGKIGVIQALFVKARGDSPKITVLNTYKGTASTLTTFSATANAVTGNIDVSTDSDCAITYFMLGGC